MYVGGAQKRPDAPYARPVVTPSGNVIGQVGKSNQKDIHGAVEAAQRRQLQGEGKGGVK